MKLTLVRSALFTALVVILPGCVLINTVLGVVGLMSSGPLQYAGAAYSIGEYSYEYAVNDKTPDEVIVEKVAWIFQIEEEPNAIQYANTVPLTTTHPNPINNSDIHLTSTRAALRPKALATAAPLTRVTLASTNLSPSKPIMVAGTTKGQNKPQAVKRLSPKAVQPRRATPTKQLHASVAQALTTPAPRHTYVERTPDPLLERMTRMEQSFALAERMADYKPIPDVRYTVKTNDAGQTITINGSWSIRHDVMQSPPPSENDSMVQTSPQKGLHTTS